MILLVGSDRPGGAGGCNLRPTKPIIPEEPMRRRSIPAAQLSAMRLRLEGRRADKREQATCLRRQHAIAPSGRCLTCAEIDVEASGVRSRR